MPITPCEPALSQGLTNTQPSRRSPELKWSNWLILGGVGVVICNYYRQFKVIQFMELIMDFLFQFMDWADSSFNKTPSFQGEKKLRSCTLYSVCARSSDQVHCSPYPDDSKPTPQVTSFSRPFSLLSPVCSP